MRFERTRTFGARDRLEQICTAPRLWLADGFLDPNEISRLLATIPHAGDPRAATLGVKHDHTGHAYELPVAFSPEVTALATRLDALIGLPNMAGETLRYRRYQAGESHPSHLDCYEYEGAALVCTVLVILEAPPVGGETVFTDAPEDLLAIEPRPGRLLVWMNHRPDGAEDPDSMHEAWEPTGGVKTTLASFLYAPPSAAARTPGAAQQPIEASKSY